MRERWFPNEGHGIYNVEDLREGDLIAADANGYRHKPWRVNDVRKRDGDDRLHVILRPDGDMFDFAQHNHPVSIGRYARIYRLPEHYGLCHHCGELTPCSEVWTESVSTEHAKQDARFEVEGICPSCQEPVTARQKSHRFEENLRVPLGPPVTFHARRRCLGGAIDYDKAVAVANGAEPRLSCTGLQTRHLDRYDECTNITCPGLDAAHGNFAMCYVLSAKCNRPECWAIQQH